MSKLGKLSDKPYFMRMLILLCLFTGAAGVMGLVAGNMSAIIAAPLLVVGLAIWKGSDETEEEKARKAEADDASKARAPESGVTLEMLNQLVSSNGAYQRPRALQDIEDEKARLGDPTMSDEEALRSIAERIKEQEN